MSLTVSVKGIFWSKLTSLTDWSSIEKAIATDYAQVSNAVEWSAYSLAVDLDNYSGRNLVRKFQWRVDWSHGQSSFIGYTRKLMQRLTLCPKT